MVGEKPQLKRTGQIDGRKMGVDFAPEAREAFRDLAAALHFSEHVSPEVLSVIHDWGASQKPSVADVVVCLPEIAEAALKHIHATGDKRAEAAWKEVKGAFLDHETHGFTLQPFRTPTR